MEILLLMAILLVTILLMVIGNSVVYKNNYVILTGNIHLSNGVGSATLAYPNNFNMNNCVVISFMGKNSSSSVEGYAYGYGEKSTDFMAGIVAHRIKLGSNDILISIKNPVSDAGENTISYKIVLMKIS